MCSGDTLVQLLHKRHEFMSETGHAPDNLLDMLIFASMFNDITNWEGHMVQKKASDVAICAASFRLGYWCFCCLGTRKDLEMQ